MIPIHPDRRTSTERSAAIAPIGTAPHPGDSEPAKLLVTPKAAAAILSIGRTKVYQLMADGQLPSVRIAGSRRIPVAAIETFVQELLDHTKEHQSFTGAVPRTPGPLAS